MNCARCGGLYLADGNDLVCVGGHRKFGPIGSGPPRREREEERVEPDESEVSVNRPRCQGRLTAPGTQGQCSKSVVDGYDFCMQHIRIEQRHGRLPSRKREAVTPESFGEAFEKAGRDVDRPPDGTRCIGRQGRGQCKKPAEPGRDYCEHHNGKATTRPKRMPDPRITLAEEEPVSTDPDDLEFINRPKAEPPAVSSKPDPMTTVADLSAVDRSKMIQLLDQEIASVDLRLNAILLHKRALISVRDGLVHGVGL